MKDWKAICSLLPEIWKKNLTILKKVWTLPKLLCYNMGRD